MSRTRSTSRRTAVSAAAGGLGLTLVATAAFIGPASATPSPKVTICHATASAQHPYVKITVDTSSIAEANHVTPNGHGTHTGPVFDPQGGQHQPAWGDIIPAFSGVNSFPGLNLTDAGRWILAHNCAVPAPTPTPTPTETTPTPTPTETTPTPTPTETTPTPTPTETTPDPTPTEPTQDPGTPTEAPTSTPDPTPSQSVSEPPEALPSTGGQAASLPKTGSSAGLVALLGAGLLGLGGVTMLAGRRRPVLDSIDADDAS